MLHPASHAARPPQLADAATPPGALRQFLQRHAHVAPVFAVSVALFYWLATAGTWRPFDMEPLSFYYDSVADGLLHGRLDVTRAAIGMEAFVRAGKHYGYFGATPALFRIPLNLLFPQCWGLWARLSMTAGFATSLLFAYRLLRAVRAATISSSGTGIREKVVDNLFLIAAGCGSTLMFLASHSFVYHEAILWGSAFALASAFWQFRFLCGGELRSLAWAGVTAFLAFHSRPTAGLGAVLGLIGIALLPLVRRVLGAKVASLVPRLTDLRLNSRHALVAVGFAALTVGSYLAQNYAKFHTLEPIPIQYYTMYQRDPARLRLTGGQLTRLTNLPTDAFAYFGRPGVWFGRGFPWLHLPPKAPVFHGAVIDNNDWCSSVPGSMPALFLLACTGVAILIAGRSTAVRAMRLPAICLAAGTLSVLTSVWLCERYLHDFYPALVVCAALGVDRLSRLPSRTLFRMAFLTIGLLSLYGVAANTAFAMEYQRSLPAHGAKGRAVSAGGAPAR
jgi:hypothetical protein